MINCKLEGLNKLSAYVYILPLANHNLESKKHMHVVDLDLCFQLPTNSSVHSKED